MMGRVIITTFQSYCEHYSYMLASVPGHTVSTQCVVAMLSVAGKSQLVGVRAGLGTQDLPRALGPLDSVLSELWGWTGD